MAESMAGSDTITMLGMETFVHDRCRSGDKSTRINEIDPLFLFDLGSFVQAPVELNMIAF